jgi:hypothetical protein
MDAGGRRPLYPEVNTPPRPFPLPAAESYLIALGVGETAETNRDGSIVANGATILSLAGLAIRAMRRLSA